jgi:hypothetical protein
MSHNNSTLYQVASGLDAVGNALETASNVGRNHAIKAAITSQTIATAVNVYSNASMSSTFAHGMANATSTIHRSRAPLWSIDPIPQDAVVNAIGHAHFLTNARPDEYASWKVDLAAWKKVGMAHRMNWDEQVLFPFPLSLALGSTNR